MKKSILSLLALSLLVGCTSRKPVQSDFTISVKNPLAFDREELVEIPMSDITERLPLVGDEQYVVTDGDGNEIGYQISFDSNLMFAATVKGGATATYTVAIVGTTSCGRTFELRRDGLPFLTASNYEWTLDFNPPNNTFASIVSSPYSYRCDVASHLIPSSQQCTVRCQYWICNTKRTADTLVTFASVAAPVVTVDHGPACSDSPVTFSVTNSVDYASITWTHEGDRHTGSSYTATFHNNTGSTVTETVGVECVTACGNQFHTSVSVQVYPAIQASLRLDDSGTRLIVDYDHSRPYSFSWSHGEDALPDVTPYYDIPSGQYGKYTCTVTANGCMLELTYRRNRAVPGEDNCPGQIELQNQCGTITASVSPSTFSTVRWSSSSPDLVFQNADANPAIGTATRAGVYIVTAQASTPTCGGTFTSQIEVGLVADYHIRYSCDGSSPHVYLVNNSTCYPYGGAISTSVSINGIGTPVTCPCDLTNPPFNFQAGQTYSFMVTASTVGPGGTTSCSQSFTITLPDEADAAFTANPDPACVNNPISLTPANTRFPSYSWNLDGATSNRVSEVRSFSVISNYSIELSVVDLYGCNNSYQHTIRVNDNILEGIIGYNNNLVCLGTPVNLKYNNQLGIPSIMLNTFSYTWSPSVINTPPYHTITVTDPTLYTLNVKDGNGCEFNMGPDGANIIVPEPPVISGRLDICQGDPVTLHSICGDPATMPNNAYQWYCDGNAIASPQGTQPQLVDYRIPSSSTTSHTFRLDVTYAGFGCSASSSVTVTEHPRPAIPLIDPNPAYYCNPYSINLQVSNVEPTGTYCWSNGDNGPAIAVSEGGAFNVTYTSPYGCKVSSNDIVVARSPESYFWTFPTGCYVMCPGDTLEVHGPAKFWDNNGWKWAFFESGISIAAGDSYSTGLDNFGLNPHLVITGAGSYDMALSNGHCAETVGTANVTMAPSCSSCSIVIDSYEFCLLSDGTVMLNLVVVNNETFPLNYNLVVRGGLVYTAHGTLQPGPNPIAPIFVPFGVVNVGDILLGRITAFTPEPDTVRCFTSFDYQVTSCGKSADLIGDSSYLGNLHTGAPFDFMLSPNPTRGGAYASFSGVGGSRVCVCVIDMKGQELLRRDVADGEQKVFLEVNSLPRGVYMVCLVSDGGVLASLKLVKQ